MKVFAFVGPSGTGKSYRAIKVARDNNIDAFIDDGLLISENSIVAGVSAKGAPTRLDSVRCALFTDESHRQSVSGAIKNNGYKSIMILATSDAMAEKIATVLDIPKISQFIRIEEISTPEEIELARTTRLNEGQHVIPVPTFRIKKYFSGYFLHPFRLLQKNLGDATAYDDEKSIVRPTFSYMGQYTISDNVIINLAKYETLKTPEVKKVLRINTRPSAHGVHIDMTISLTFGCHIPTVCEKIQSTVAENLNAMTSINIRRVNILVRTLVMEGN